MKKFSLIILASLLIILSCSDEVSQKEVKKIKEDYLYQYSYRSSLLNKEFYKDFRLKEILDRGDFGLGTLNGVDGELVILDKKFYQVKYSGEILTPETDSKFPFANFKKFKADTTLKISSKNFLETREHIRELNSEKNALAIKIVGNFSVLKARSVKKVNPGEKTLAEIIKEQSVFEFENIKGTLVGFYIPKSHLKNCFTGFHFHFLSDDKLKGGHILNFEITNADIWIDIAEDGLMFL